MRTACSDREKDVKKVLIGLGILVVVAGIVLWRVYANLDKIVANYFPGIVGAEIQVGEAPGLGVKEA